MYKAPGITIKTWRAYISILVATGLLCLPVAAFASSSGAISQSFNATTSGITTGTILSLEQGSDTVVEPASSATSADNLEGIVANNSLVELSSNQQNAAQVVVSGITPTLVSDINGTINPGDHIAPSPISGIGMKATTPTATIGTAQASLSSVTTVDKTVVDKNGQHMTIKVGLIPIAVNVSYFSDLPTQGSIASYIPPFLQKTANNISGGKSVSPLRVLIGSIGLLLGFITVTLMLYTSIRSGVTSMGRNPLAVTALRRGFVDVLIAAFGIVVVTVIVVYVVVAK
jgi:hypothetical protein